MVDLWKETLRWVLANRYYLPQAKGSGDASLVEDKMLELLAKQGGPASG